MTPSNRQIPAQAWDTHHHIFEPDKYKLDEDRDFTPSHAPPSALQAYKDSLGIENTVIAHSLTHGTDCASLLDYLAYFKPNARGICVFDSATVTDERLDEYHAAGVRSVRVDFFKAKAMNDIETQLRLVQRHVERLHNWRPGQWSVQIQQANLEYWGRVRDIAKTSPIPIVVDHLGLLPMPSMTGKEWTQAQQDGFQQLLGALEDGNLWMKISAPYRCSDQAPRYADLKESVQAMVKAGPKRVLWGSDWPHTQRHKDREGTDPNKTEAFLKIDNQAWIISLGEWLSKQEWQDMWVNNPLRLYG